MTTPVRIQRKRTKDFNLQAASPNGLPVVYVGRPTKWGNPFALVGPGRPAGEQFYDLHDLMTREGCVGAFREWLDETEEGRMLAAEAVEELRGKNLACWCSLDDFCHADVWLEVANK